MHGVARRGVEGIYSAIDFPRAVFESNLKVFLYKLCRNYGRVQHTHTHTHIIAHTHYIILCIYAYATIVCACVYDVDDPLHMA